MSIKIQEAELLTSNSINDTTRIWKQGNVRRLRDLVGRTRVILKVDSTFHRTPRNHVITGMRLRYEDRVLYFDIASSAVNILNGVITLTTPTWITSEHNADNFINTSRYGRFHDKQVFSYIPRPLKGGGFYPKIHDDDRNFYIGLYM